MRKLFILLWVALAFSCKNEVVDLLEPENDDYYIPLSENMEVAKSVYSFLQERGTIINKQMSVGKVNSNIVSLKKEIFSDDGTVIMRIFNYGKDGFVILAADSRANPILAYSNESGFLSDTIPPATEAWLYENKLQIEEIRTQNIKEEVGVKLLKKNNYLKLLNGTIPYEVTEQAPSKVLFRPLPPDGECEGTSFEYGPLLKTTWSQEGGYNNLMPNSSCTPFYCNNKAFTGCVATAMAQVMRYHEYPSGYNYNIMPNKVSSYFDFSPGANEISRLMRDAAGSVNSQYDCNGTGAASDLNDIPHAMKNTFGYSITAKSNDFNYSTVKDEIVSKRPVILSGYSEKSGFIFHTYKGGHVWIVDGVRGGTVCPEIMPDGTSAGGASFLYFHMNWGWGGSNNGWFGFASADSGNGNYQYKRGMVYSIKK